MAWESLYRMRLAQYRVEYGERDTKPSNLYDRWGVSWAADRLFL